MNRQLFLQLLEHPDSVSEQESIALQKFTEDFPYCQTGRLLFVKHLHSQQSVHYPEQLKIAAAYAADRKVLYNLIHTPSPALPQGGGEYVLTENEEEEPIVHSQPAVDEKAEYVEKNSEPPAEIIPEKKNIEESFPQTDVIQKRLQEISDSKASSLSTLQRRGESTPEPEIISVKEEVPIQVQEIIEPKIPEEKKPGDLKSGKHSFTDWLKAVKKEPAPATVSPENNAPSDPSADEIIDRFIETEPRIVPSKVEFYNPVKIAKQSLEEHDDLVSETLAGIFAEQGNLPRAIEMYRKLMLSNPEKSSFFAALVEKLTQQLNEGK